METTKRLRGRPKSFHDKSSQNRVQALDRAWDVLEFLASGNGRTLSEIAENLSQSAATMYRVLATLAARDVVQMDPVSQEWFVGPASFRIGSAFLRRTGVVERARPMLRNLMVNTGETANLGTEVANQVMFVSQVETQQAIRAFFPLGSQSPMHASGIGKALLAFSTTEKIDTYLAKQPLVRFTDKTICAADELRRELAQIKAQGYALDDEEKNTGMRCVAAPVFNAYGEVVAGISVSGPTVRLTIEHIQQVSQLVMDQATALSLTLGVEPTR